MQIFCGFAVQTRQKHNNKNNKKTETPKKSSKLPKV